MSLKTDEDRVMELMEATNAVRVRVWKKLSNKERALALIDVEGTIAPNIGGSSCFRAGPNRMISCSDPTAYEDTLALLSHATKVVITHSCADRHSC